MKSEKNNFSKNPEFIKSLFNSISRNYDKLNDIMSFGLQKRIKRDVIKKIQPFTSHFSHLTCLDLCTGTGDLAGMLKKKYPQSEVIGVDFSSKMLEIAKEKHSDIEFIEADCSSLPFKDKTFNLCVISFGLRNVENIENVLKEIYRVL